MSRYLVALIADEMQLTSDLWCSEVSCRINLASQCLEDGMRIIDYPVAIETQSKLICRGVKSSLACITNNTDLCELDTIPQYLSNGFMQLYQFSAAFCASETGNGVTSGLPRDLIAPVYLAALTASEWTSVNDMCSVYNATLRMAATERISMATNIEHLLTWQQVTSISLDKLSDMCLNNHSYNCQWVEVLANQNPVCDVETAKQCVDMVLLSKLTVDVILMRSSWQTVCSVAYDMLACAQYHTRACVTSDLSEILQATQEVENLVGYECNQLGASGSQEVCDVEHKFCDSANAVHECIMVAYGLTDRCKEQEKIYNCFKNHLHACNSIQKVPAQFTFEWLLNNCSTNLTLLEEDMYVGVSQCKLRYGYNIFNGLLTYSDFNSMICAVTSLYRQCLADQSFPSLATLYMQEVDDFFSFMQQTTCNNTQSSSDISTVAESNECSFVETAGTVTLSIEFYSNFPFMSLNDQEVVCRTYPSFKDIWVSRATSCTARRQKLISDAIVYFNTMHDSLCSVSRADVPRSCDETRANICLEDFGSFTYFATKNSDVCGKLEDTYNCLMESTTGCDESTHNALLQEVKTMHSMLGNVTCPKMQWCTTVNATDLFPWQREICSEWNKCLIFDWMSCVDQFNLQFSCQSSTEGIDCIEQKLSSCDPLQILLAKSEISAWVQQNSACNVVPSDPPAVTQVYRNIYECSSYISMATEISKQALCFMINQYINCLASLDQSEVRRVWKRFPLEGRANCGGKGAVKWT
ncbi:uncharacterized protein LOC132733685 [Ruditapes philippinarum]|uniref:uncharacterized protein LOC132733685 n=1 Tax=Ruditapes philippinarum TaxID=129788 RepID=UPI00295B8C6F|nr:uncharacterized protein LOC132733685 [Ruditapes philippinarum]